MTSNNNDTMLQWVAIRRAGLPEYSDKWTKLHEHVQSREVITFWYFKQGNIFEMWVTYYVHDVLVKVAQLGWLMSTTSGIVHYWTATKPIIESFRRMMKSAVQSEYGNGASFLYHWIEIGNHYLAGYQPMIVDDWEEKQLQDAIANGADWVFEDKTMKLENGYEAMAWVTERPDGDEEVDEPLPSSFADFIATELLPEEEDDKDEDDNE